MSLHNTDDTARLLGEYGARIEYVEQTLTRMSTDVHAIRTSMDEVRGGWKVAIWVAGIVGALVSFFATVFYGK